MTDLFVAPMETPDCGMLGLGWAVALADELKVMGRQARRWRQGINQPAALMQAVYVGGGLTIIGLLGVGRSFGTDSPMRWLGALVTVCGLTLIVLAIHRLRR